MIEIKEGAIFLSDAHANSSRPQFLKFLKKLIKKEIITSQLFLLGDIFDFLASEVSYTKEFYKEEIELLNKLSRIIEIIYIEGNHDFNLQKIFPHIKVFPLSKQPLIVKYKSQRVMLLHGDKYESKTYHIAHFFLRNSFVLSFLNLIDGFIDFKLSQDYIKKADKKKICRKIENFPKTIKQKILLNDIGVSEIDFVLEGHHHQGVGFTFDDAEYFNLSSFACDERYYIAKGDKITFQ
jgi:UDP-2,3-diacylglucosamine hydrolase